MDEDTEVKETVLDWFHIRAPRELIATHIFLYEFGVQSASMKSNGISITNWHTDEMLKKSYTLADYFIKFGKENPPS
jgi:hypothetical protein